MSELGDLRLDFLIYGHNCTHRKLRGAHITNGVEVLSQGGPEYIPKLGNALRHSRKVTVSMTIHDKEQQPNEHGYSVEIEHFGMQKAYVPQNNVEVLQRHNTYKRSTGQCR